MWSGKDEGGERKREEREIESRTFLSLMVILRIARLSKGIAWSVGVVFS